MKAWEYSEISGYSLMIYWEVQHDIRLNVPGDVIDRHSYGLLILQKIMKMGNVKMILEI